VKVKRSALKRNTAALSQSSLPPHAHLLAHARATILKQAFHRHGRLSDIESLVR
jgi:hypothetical protein